MASEAHEVIGLKLGRIDLKLGATQHGWLAEQLEKLTHFMRPLVSMAVEEAARKALDRSLAIVREQGGCAFVQGSLAESDIAKLQFTTYEPIEAHRPVFGDLLRSARSCCRSSRSR